MLYQVFKMFVKFFNWGPSSGISWSSLKGSPIIITFYIMFPTCFFKFPSGVHQLGSTEVNLGQLGLTEVNWGQMFKPLLYISQKFVWGGIWQGSDHVQNFWHLFVIQTMFQVSDFLRLPLVWAIKRKINWPTPGILASCSAISYLWEITEYV